MVLRAGRKCVDEGGVCGRWGWSGVEGGWEGGGGDPSIFVSVLQSQIFVTVFWTAIFLIQEYNAYEKIKIK